MVITLRPSHSLPAYHTLVASDLKVTVPIPNMVRQLLSWLHVDGHTIRCMRCQPFVMLELRLVARPQVSVIDPVPATILYTRNDD